MAVSSITVRPITPLQGAEIGGVDLNDLTPAQEADICQVLTDRKAIVFRDQKISPERFAMFMHLFGKPVDEDLEPIDGNPRNVGVIHIRANEKQTINFWHMDHSFRADPAPKLALYTKTLPECGGDTLFASLESAYDGLSDEMKERIAPLWAIHQVRPTQNSRRRYTDAEFQAMMERKTRHPLVGWNPENGRKFLFVNTPVYLRYVDGMDPAESEALLDELYRHVQRPEYSFRLVWRPDTLVVWENAHCLHYPVADYFPHERKLLRVAITGEPIAAVPAP
ncbi:MAG: TauD/TfdA family dioxygenase [Proteobacteria bacterium]|nr:TauD/TfdA family dioxygenase [Pseudomonadota bacterium]